MTSRHSFTIALFLSLCFGCRSIPSEEKHFEKLVDAEVVARSVLPPYSGILRTWVVITIRLKDTQLDVLIPYFHADQNLPAVGDTCEFITRQEQVNGLAGDKVVDTTTNIVADFKCPT